MVNTVRGAAPPPPPAQAQAQAPAPATGAPAARARTEPRAEPPPRPRAPAVVPPRTAAGALTPPAAAAAPGPAAGRLEVARRAEAMVTAYREQSSLVLGALLAQPVASFNLFESGQGRILRDDAMHATLRLNTALWTVARDMREGRLEPASFGRTSWDGVTAADLYGLGVRRLRTSNEPWERATHAMLADTSLPALRVRHPERGVIDVTPDAISFMGRSPVAYFAPNNAAGILERMQVGQAMRDAAVRTAGAPREQREAARAAGLVETAATLSVGSTAPAHGQRPLPANDAMTAEALAHATGTYARLEPLAPGTTEEALRARLERQEIVGLVPRRAADGTTTLMAAVPFRNDQELAHEVHRRLAQGELAHLDEPTRRRIAELVGPEDAPGARLAARVSDQASDRERRERYGGYVQMALLAVPAAAGGALVGAGARALGLGVRGAQLTAALGQGVAFTAMQQGISGHFDAWQYPMDMAMFGLLSRVGPLAHGMSRWIGSSTAPQRMLSHVAAAGVAIGTGATASTAIAATREVIETGRVPDGDRVARQFTDALVMGVVLHGVNTGLNRVAPHIGTHSVAYRELQQMGRRSELATRELSTRLGDLDRLASEGAALRARNLPADHPERIANAGAQVALMQQVTAMSAQIQGLRADAAAFASAHLPAGLADRVLRDLEDGEARPASGPAMTARDQSVTSAFARNDAAALRTLRLGELSPTVRAQLSPGGALFSDAVLRGGPLLDGVLAMHRAAGTSPAWVVTGVAEAYVNAGVRQPRVGAVAQQLIDSFGLQVGNRDGDAGGAVGRVSQVLSRVIEFHSPSEWGRVVPALLDDAATSLRAGAPGSIPVAEGLQRVAAIRALRHVSGSRNIGYLQYDLVPEPGAPRLTGELEAVSGRPHNYQRRGAVALVSQADRRALDFSNDRNPRLHDTEWVLLENIASSIGPRTRGTIRLFSERPCCPSCQLVIARFQRQFPNVQLLFNHGPGQ